MRDPIAYWRWREPRTPRCSPIITRHPSTPSIPEVQTSASSICDGLLARLPRPVAAASARAAVEATTRAQSAAPMLSDGPMVAEEVQTPRPSRGVGETFSVIFPLRGDSPAKMPTRRSRLEWINMSPPFSTMISLDDGKRSRPTSSLWCRRPQPLGPHPPARWPGPSFLLPRGHLYLPDTGHTWPRISDCAQ